MRTENRNVTLSRESFRRWLAHGVGPTFSACLVTSALATGLASNAFGQIQEAKKVEEKQTAVIVLNDKDGGKEKILEQLRDKLQLLPEEQRDKILKQVEESLEQAFNKSRKEQRVVVTTVDADGKPLASEGNVVTMTIVQDGDKGKEANKAEGPTRVEARVLRNLDINQDGMPKELLKLLPQIQGERIVQGFGLAEGIAAPRFRIGLSVEAPNDEKEEDTDDKSSKGLVVQQVMEESPASEAGIEEGDVILSINGQEAEDFSDLQKAVQEAGQEDRALKLKIQRDGKEITIKVKPTKSEEAPSGGFGLIPRLGSVLPIEVMGGEGGTFVVGPAQNGQLDLSETKQQIAELKEEIQELKAMVKKLLDSSDKRDKR